MMPDFRYTVSTKQQDHMVEAASTNWIGLALVVGPVGSDQQWRRN